MERRKREEERRKAVTLLSKKSPKSHHLTIEQRHYQMKIKELRTKSERRSNNNNNSDPETDSSAPEEKDREREPHLTNITSEYDLKLFQEAQAAASEKIVISASFSVYCFHYPGECLESQYMFQCTKFTKYLVTFVVCYMFWHCCDTIR